MGEVAAAVRLGQDVMEGEIERLRSALLIAEADRDSARSALVEAGERLSDAYAARDEARAERDRARAAVAALRAAIRELIAECGL